MSEPGKQRKIQGRWLPGQSGNPSGRPRGSVSLKAAVRRVMTRADAEAIARKLVRMGRSGSLRAVELLVQLLDDAQLEERLHALEARVSQLSQPNNTHENQN